MLLRLFSVWIILGIAAHLAKASSHHENQLPRTLHELAHSPVLPSADVPTKPSLFEVRLNSQKMQREMKDSDGNLDQQLTMPTDIIPPTTKTSMHLVQLPLNPIANWLFLRKGNGLIDKYTPEPSPITPNILSHLDLMLRYALLGFCRLDQSWTCPFCTNTKEGRQTVFVKTISSSVLKSHVLAVPARRQIMIPFRALTRPKEVLQAVKFYTVPYPYASLSTGANAKVHAGWFYAYNEVADETWLTVKELVDRVGKQNWIQQGWKINTMGYSYGGPLSQLAASDIFHRLRAYLNSPADQDISDLLLLANNRPIDPSEFKKKRKGFKWPTFLTREFWSNVLRPNSLRRSPDSKQARNVVKAIATSTFFATISDIPLDAYQPNVNIYTYGSPRLYTSDAARYIFSLHPHLLHVRVTNKSDFISHIPTRQQDFSHEGTEVFITEIINHHDPVQKTTKPERVAVVCKSGWREDGRCSVKAEQGWKMNLGMHFEFFDKKVDPLVKCRAAKDSQAGVDSDEVDQNGMRQYDFSRWMVD